MRARIVWYRLGQTAGDHTVHLPKKARILTAALHNSAAALCVLVPDPPIPGAGLGIPHTIRLVETGAPFDLGDDMPPDWTDLADGIRGTAKWVGVIELPAETLVAFHIGLAIERTEVQP